MNEGIAYLQSLDLFRVKPGLDRIKKIAQYLGNPQDKIPSILIAGTNGKGSVAAAIASVLETQGYRAGLYTSPHLVRVTERIKVNGQEIAIDELSSLISEVKRVSQHLLIEPSYFEVLTAAAFMYFALGKADFAVLEVGMGGRWDATNLVLPLCSVITNVSMDHTQFLGESIEEIAHEKAGVIKPGIPTITGAKGEALRVIHATAKELSSPTVVMGRDFYFQGETTEGFDYYGKKWQLEHLNFSLRGIHQLENASIAIATLENISKFHGIRLDEKALRKGLSAVKWEGRIEFIRYDPPFILDGAHNQDGARALSLSLHSMYPDAQFTFLIGMLNDKDHEKYLREISEVAERIIITGLPSKRGISAERLGEIARGYVQEIEVIEDFRQAFSKVKNLSTHSCATGSLYLIGAIKSLINSD
jgi:dihydrofolate synthase/folylpolyglutamate synthase